MPDDPDELKPDTYEDDDNDEGDETVPPDGEDDAA